MSGNNKIEINRATMGAVMSLIRGLAVLGICPSCVMSFQDHEMQFQEALNELMSKAKVGDMRKFAIPSDEVIEELIRLKKKHGIVTYIEDMETEHE